MVDVHLPQISISLVQLNGYPNSIFNFLIKRKVIPK
jgi:hypothetical protein